MENNAHKIFLEYQKKENLQQFPTLLKAKPEHITTAYKVPPLPLRFSLTRTPLLTVLWRTD